MNGLKSRNRLLAEFKLRGICDGASRRAPGGDERRARGVMLREIASPGGLTVGALPGK